MKKFLCSLIAISLIFSMFPIAFADGETTETSHVETYEFNSGTNGSVKLSTIEYTDTRSWKYLAMSDELAAKEDAGTGKIARVYPKTADGIYFAAIKDVVVNFAIALRAPKTSGFYIPALAWYSGSSGDKELDWFMDINDEGKKNFDDYAITPNFILENESVSGAKSYTSTSKTAIYSINADEIATAFSVTANKVYKFNSITLTQILNPVMTTTVDNVSLDLTDTDTANDTATASTTVSGKKVVDSTETAVTDMPVSNNFITYKSSDEAVAAVATDGTITATGGGKAEVWAETPDGAVSSAPITVTVTAPEAAEPEETLSGVTVVYDISAARDNGGIDDFKKIDYAFTDGFFEYAGNSLSLTSPDGDELKNVGTKGQGRNGLRIKVKTAKDNWWALKIKVPASGKYTPKATYWKYGGRGNGAESYMDYYLIKDDGSGMTSLLTDENLTTTSEYYIGEKSSVDSSLESGQSIVFDEAFDKYVDLDAGEYYLVYKTRNVSGSSNYAVASNFTLDGGTGSAPMFCLKTDADEITVGKTNATVTASAKLSNPTPSATTGNRTYTFSDASLTDITYSVADDDAEVASVTSEGVVTGKSYGVATINASAKYGEENLSDSLEISVVTPPVLDKEITYAEKTHTGGDANVFTFKAFSTDGESLNVEFDESTNITLGEKTTVSTDDTITVNNVKYNFLYWAKGATMAKKQIVSFEEKFDYLPGEGSNFLIAVYEPETEGSGDRVEFYNGNGQLLPAYALVDGKLPDYPSMAGYGTAYGWALKDGDGYVEYSAGDDVSELTGNLMFAAMYGEKEDITVFVDGTARTVKYGDTVTCTPDSSKGTLMYWMKDGTVVSLEDTYSFLAWEDCRVEAVYGTNKPELSAATEMRKILLDRFAAGEETAIMAEFIGFDDAVEKGIMFGNQKIAMSSTSSQFTVLDDAATANEAYAYAIIPDGTGYKILTDGIAHIGVNEEELLSARRKIAVDYMRKMATVLWTPSEDITYTTGSSEDSLSFTLEKGKIYRGVPYAYSSGSYETFMEFVGEPDANGVYTVSGLDGTALSGGQGKVRLGNDCSGAVVRAWSKFGANIQAKTTSNMTAKNGFIKVGDYDDLGITSYSSSVQTTEITGANGKDVMFAAYAELKPADVVVHYLGGYGHVMMISEIDVKNQKVKIIDQTRAHMKTWTTDSPDTMEIENVGTVYNIYGEDVEYTFSELYSGGYLPVTCRELREANYIADEVTFRDTLGEESHTLRNIFRGTIHSTKAIDTVKVEILDDGTVVQDAKASVARANIFAFDMQQFVTDTKSAIRGTGINTDSLASGTYTCMVTVYLTADAEGTTVRNFTFTK